MLNNAYNCASQTVIYTQISLGHLVKMRILICSLGAVGISSYLMPRLKAHGQILSSQGIIFKISKLYTGT